MKLIKLTSMVLFAGLVISGVGCTKKIDEFGDINVNPAIVAELIQQRFLQMYYPLREVRPGK
jgi:hypothetical protein